MISFCFLESLGGWPRSVSGRLGLYLNKFVTLFNHKIKVQLSILVSIPFFHSPNLLNITFAAHCRPIYYVWFSLYVILAIDQYYVWFSLCVILAMVSVVCYSSYRPILCMIFVVCYFSNGFRCVLF